MGRDSRVEHAVVIPGHGVLLLLVEQGEGLGVGGGVQRTAKLLRGAHPRVLHSRRGNVALLLLLLLLLLELGLLLLELWVLSVDEGGGGVWGTGLQLLGDQLARGNLWRVGLGGLGTFLGEEEWPG